MDKPIVTIVCVIFCWLLGCSQSSSGDVKEQNEIKNQNSAISNTEKDEFKPIDIRIIRLLVENIYSDRPWQFFDQYESFYLDRELYRNILKSQFSDSIDVDKTMKQLESNLMKVVKFQREIVADDYKEFNSLEGRNFSFLYTLGDSSVNYFLRDIQQNDLASDSEKARLAESYPLLQSK